MNQKPQHLAKGCQRLTQPHPCRHSPAALGILQLHFHQLFQLTQAQLHWPRHHSCPLPQPGQAFRRLTKQRKEDRSSEEREHTFQCQKTHEEHEGAGLAPCGTHEAKSTWHSLGAQVANGSALAMPHCQGVSTSCPKYTHSSQDVPRSRGKLYLVSWHVEWCHHPTRGIYNSLYTWAKFRNPGISRKTRWVTLYRK